MNIKPIYEVSVAGDVLDISGRLRSLTITQDRERTDSIGTESVEIVLDDTTLPRLMIPPRGRALRVKIGYDGGGLVDKGVFIVDETEVNGPPNVLIIRAQNNPKTPHDTTYLPMATRMNRSWPQPLTVQDLVTQIAIDHGLFPVVAPSLASIALPHIDQADMSDLELLQTYVQRVYDAFAIVQDSKLMVLPNGTAVTANGDDIPLITARVAVAGEALASGRCYVASWRTRFVDFQAFQTVKARWHDYATATDVTETVGNGSQPILRLPFPYPSRAAAMAAAQTAWNRSNSSVGSFHAEFTGTPELIAGGLVTLSGAHPDLEGVNWYCRRVHHSIDRDGFWTSVEGERQTIDLTADLAGS